MLFKWPELPGSKKEMQHAFRAQRGLRSKQIERVDLILYYRFEQSLEEKFTTLISLTDAESSM